MKRLLCALVCVSMLMGCVGAGGEAPDPEKVAEGALVLMQALMMCPRAQSFEDIPTCELAHEAIRAYRALTQDAESDDKALCALLFADGVCETPDEGAENALLDIQITIDSAIDSGDGLIVVSLTVYADEGYGYEFYCLADIYLKPDPEAPCGARIARLFFPE